VRDNQVVPWRRFLFFAVLLLVAASAVSAVAPRERRFDEMPSRGKLPSTNPPASVVRASLPGDDEVHARVGDVVRLTVSAPSTDVVELTSLALEQPVDAGVPAEVVFVADRPGRFRVRLREAGEAIGTLRVAN
jgi:hypothetical protein